MELDHDDTYVRVRRWVEDDGLEEERVTWDGAIRNVPTMVEYYSDEASSFQVIVDMMLLAQEDGLYPLVWITGPDESDLLKKWLEVDRRGLPVKNVQNLVGLPIHRVKSIPEETLILCCSKYPGASPDEITMAVKTTVDLRRSHEPDNKDDGRSGNHPSEHPSAAGQLALSARGLRPVPWSPPGGVGHG